MYFHHPNLNALAAENERLREDLQHVRARAADINENNQHLKQEVLLLQGDIERTEVAAEEELERMRWNVRNTTRQLMDFKKIVEDIGLKIETEIQMLDDAYRR